MGCGAFNVCAVNDFDAFLTTLGSPMDILAGFDRQAAQAAGVKPTTYIEWEKAHEMNCSPLVGLRNQLPTSGE